METYNAACLSEEEEKAIGEGQCLPNHAMPKTLDDAVNLLLSWCSNLQEYMRTNEQEHVVVELHHGFGTGIRNMLGLWKGSGACPITEAPLYYHLYEKGLRHPDDMSGVIINAIWHKVNEVEYDIATDIQEYLEYWKDMDERAFSAISDTVDSVISKHTKEWSKDKCLLNTELSNTNPSLYYTLYLAA